jgi:hypothetical protein
MSNPFHPEAISDAFKAAMILYQQAKSKTSEGNDTVVKSIMDALNPQQQDPQQQNPQQAAQPPSMGDVVGQAENAVPTQQQNAQMAAAQQMQGAAQGMPPGADQQQQMQPPDAGIAGLPASNTQQFKEGGVIGFERGGFTAKVIPKVGEEEEDKFDPWNPRGSARLTNYAGGPHRGNVVPVTASKAVKSEAAKTPPDNRVFPEVPRPENEYAKIMAMISGMGGGGGGGGGGMPDMDKLTAQAEKIRNRLVERPDTSPLDAIERMVNRHYAERPDIEGDALRNTEEAYAKEKEGRGMEAFLTRAAMMGKHGSSGLLDAHFEIKKQVAEAEDLHRKEVTLQRLAQQAVKDRNLGDLVGIKKALQEVNDAQAKLRSEGGINLLGGILTSDTHRRDRDATAANAGLSARARMMAAITKGSKPPAAMTIAEAKIVNDLVQSTFKNLNNPTAKKYILALPNGAQILTDVANGRPLDHPDIAPKLAVAMNAFKKDFIGQTNRAGTQPITSIESYLSSMGGDDAGDDNTED